MACTRLLYGYDGLTEQPKRQKYSIKNGWTTVRTWEGPRDKADPLLADLIDSCEDFEITDGPVCRVAATFGSDGTDTGGQDTERVTWDFSFEIAELPLDTFNYYQEVGIRDIIAKVKFKLDHEAQIVVETGAEEGEINLSDIPGYSSCSNEQKTKIKEYLKFRNKGVSSYDESRPVIIKNITKSWRNETKYSLEGCNKYDEYVNIGVPTDANFEEPKYTLEDGTLDSYDWLKLHPNISFDGIRTNIQQKWVGFWNLSARLYDGTGAP